MMNGKDRDSFNNGGVVDNWGTAVGDSSRSGFDDDGGSVNNRSMNGVDDRSSMNGLNDNGSGVHYGSVDGVHDGRSVNDWSVDSVDNRSAMVNDLRRLGNSGLGSDYGNSVSVDYRGCVDCGYDGGRVGEDDAGRRRGASQKSGESYL